MSRGINLCVELRAKNPMTRAPLSQHLVPTLAAEELGETTQLIDGR